MPRIRLRYNAAIEEAIDDLSIHLRGPYRISQRSLALLLLQGDASADRLVRETEGEAYATIAQLVEDLQAKLGRRLEADLHAARAKAARQILAAAVTGPTTEGQAFAVRLGQWCTRPVTGIPLLLLVIAVGLYGFVGLFGGKFLVDLLEVRLFEHVLTPYVKGWVEASHIPWLTALLVGEYGIWTLAITYAFGLILPLVGTFFLAFSLLEDSGYLPRLAMLVDRIFKYMGLSGRAVIPLILGFGCDTMATIVTRILETRRERILATFLLSLAIPCSAQLGVMTGLLAGRPAAFLIWGGIMAGTLLFTGYLAAQIIPGEKPFFVLELPPMRLPMLSNVVAKTLARMHWYFMEVVPIFVAASVILWLADLTGALQAALHAIRPITIILGLPPKASEAFLFGFFRRDYGAAGLYRLQAQHLLNGNQQLVAVVTLTLFLPCIAQLLVMFKERGFKASLAMVAFILPFALGVGSLLNWILNMLRVQL
jgi:ferrous iron transport protein B